MQTRIEPTTLQLIDDICTADSLAPWPQAGRSRYDYVINLRDKLDATMKIAQDNITGASGKFKFYYDKKTKHKHFEVGDNVLLLQPNKQNLLQTPWNGPYTICEKIHLNDHRIRLKDKIMTYHANFLKKFTEKEEEEPAFGHCVANAHSTLP